MNLNRRLGVIIVLGTLFSFLLNAQPDSRPKKFVLDTNRIKVHEFAIEGKTDSRFEEPRKPTVKYPTNAVWVDGGKPNHLLIETLNGYVIAFNLKSDLSVNLLFLNSSFEETRRVKIETNAKLGGFALTKEGFALGILKGMRTEFWLYVLDQEGRVNGKTLVMGDCDPEVEGCKHSPLDFGSARIGYVPGDSSIIVFMAHLQKYADGISHQAGFLEVFDLKGQVKKHSPFSNKWIFSHCYEYRLLCEEKKIIALGNGDAYPRGIGFYMVPRPKKSSLNDSKVLFSFYGTHKDADYQYVGARLGGFNKLNNKYYALTFSYFSDSLKKEVDQLRYLLMDTLLNKKKSVNVMTSKGCFIFNPKSGVIDSGLVVSYELVKPNSNLPQTYIGLLNPMDGKWKMKPFYLKGYYLPLDTDLVVDRKGNLLWVQSQRPNELQLVVWETAKRSDSGIGKTQKKVKNK